MKLSRRDYGTRALIELAIRYGSAPIGVKSIAKRQAIPVKYLEQIMGPLKRANLVASVRGAFGGYRLARPPAEITLAEVFEVLGGPLAFSGCDGSDSHCALIRTCPTRAVYGRIRDTVARELAAVTLADLALRQKELEAEQAFAYSI